MLIKPIACLFFVLAINVDSVKIKPYAKFSTNVLEPSDITYSTDNNFIYIVSDKGFLCKTDTSGKTISTAKYKGLDFEGICLNDKLIYVTDERTRRIVVYNEDLEFVKQNEVAYNGGMNLGYEGITFNPKKNCFIVVTEKDPTWFFELNNDLIKTNEIKLKIASDVSSICYYNDFIYALSDEDQMVIKLNPLSYEVIQKWKIPVTNPEGICFDKSGNLIVLSDMEQKIYKFQIQK